LIIVEKYPVPVRLSHAVLKIAMIGSMFGGFLEK
jgi:hypothetical protein